MSAVIERLETLRVDDAMCARVVEIPHYKTMTEAAMILTAKEVSAAPVVGDQGRCMGIISTTDFAKCVAATAAEPETTGRLCPADVHWQTTPAYDEPVTTYMTAAVQTIKADAPLVTAVRMMCAQHYHRLIVLDDAQRPVGVISTMDIVAALVNLADEARTFEEIGKRS